MAKILYANQVFNELSLGTLYETEVELALKQRANKIFPGFIYSDFKCPVSSDYDTRIPDFALIEEHYRGWWVCELERENHSLEGHVLPQVRAFVHGRYGAAAVETLVKSNAALDRARLQRLIQVEQPQVLVVVNKYREHWSRAIRSEGAELGVFEIFRSDRGQVLFRVNGFVPAPFLERLSICEPYAPVPRLVRLRSPGAVDFEHGAIYEIQMDIGTTLWRAIVTADSVLLSPLGGATPPRAKLFALNKDALNNLSFVPIS
jgi:hypothetical protein